MIFIVAVPMVVGPVLGDMACRNAAATYPNEFGVETIVPSKNMFFVAGIVCLPEGICKPQTRTERTAI